MSTVPRPDHSVPPPSPGEPGPLFWMGARTLTHIGEFRRYYALLAVWLVVMAVAPRTTNPVDTFGTGGLAATAPAAGSSARRAPESAVAAALSRPSTPSASTFFADPILDGVTGPATFGGGSEDADDGGFAGRPSSGPSSFDFSPPPEEEDPKAAPEEGSSIPIDIPPPPPLPLPPPPPELEPLLRVATPLGNTACSPIGLAGVVVALVGPSVEQVPVAQIVPYLTPLYVACATFPQIGPRTVCEIDRAYIAQDPSGGLLPPPAVIGLGIDTIAQMEAALGGLSNQAQTLREQLNCQVGNG